MEQHFLFRICIICAAFIFQYKTYAQSSCNGFQTSIDGINISCFGYNNGSVNLTVTGGVKPYTFIWSNGAATEDLSSLAADTYSVTVIDSNGCTASNNITITQPAHLSTTEIHTNVSCYGLSDGAIYLSVSGGTTPFTFDWSNGANTEDATGLTASTNDVTVTDANGCMTKNRIIVTQPDPLTTTETHANVTCYGLSDGSIDLTVNGGTAPFTFDWSNGANTEDATGLIASTNDVAVTDANGCVTKNSIIVTQPDPLTTSEIHKNVTCYGLSNGSIDLKVSGGTGPFKFDWSNGANTEDATGLIASTNDVIVTDANGCVTKNSIIITQPALLTTTETHTNVTCNGMSNGSIDLTVNGGIGPYSFIWSNGANTEDATGLNASTNNVIVTDINGCKTNNTIIITQPALLTTTEIHTNELCSGSNGTIDVTVSGGTTPYIYNWSNGATTQDLNNIVAGTYSVIVTDAKGCSTNKSITISQSSQKITVTETHSNVSCQGKKDGSIDITVSGGTTPYSYNWSPTGAVTQDISGLSAGTYTVIVTDSKGCTASKSVAINQSNSLTFSENHSDVSCWGNDDGLIDITVTGGNSPYKYKWNTGSTKEDLRYIDAGNYSVTVTDAHGCTISGTASIETAPATGFVTGTQQDWGAKANKTNPNFGNTLQTYFSSIYWCPNYFKVGYGSRFYLFTKADALEAYLPSSGNVTTLPIGTAINPINDNIYKNSFAGEVIALTLNVDFDYEISSFSPSSKHLGGLIIVTGPFAGKTVDYLLTVANKALGNGFNEGYTLSQINETVIAVNANFANNKNNGYLVNSCSNSGCHQRLAASSNQSNIGKIELTSYPNPFVENTNIEFTLTYDSPVTVEICNFTGERIATIFNGDVNASEKQLFTVSGSDLAEGVYYCKVITNQGTTINKLVLAK